MSSFRNHRVIIASLFLPSTVVVGESEAVTPDRQPEGNAAVSIPAVAQRLAKEATKPLKSALSNKSALQPAHNSHSRSSSATGTILSIVEDLKDKVRCYLNQNPINLIKLPYTVPTTSECAGQAGEAQHLYEVGPVR